MPAPNAANDPASLRQETALRLSDTPAIDGWRFQHRQYVVESFRPGNVTVN